MAKRTRITRPYPTHSFQDSVPIAETIQRVNGGLPVETELLAKEMGTSARSSSFIQKLNASSKYGLTVGSYSDDFIQLTELGESVTAPGSAEERDNSVLEAVTKPEVFSEFYRRYAGKRMPEDIYASNTLVRDLGVPRELTEECLSIIRRNGLVAGIVSDRAGVLVVGAVAESEEAGYYAGAEPSRHDHDQDSTSEIARVPKDAQPDSGEILVAGTSEDQIRGEVVGLLEGVSVASKTVSLDETGGRIISQELSEALGSARGCVLVWPGDIGADGEQTLKPAVWAALGAMSYRVGRRLVVVLRDGDLAADPLENDPGMTVVRAADGESVYPKLMGALVQSGIVRISVG